MRMRFNRGAAQLARLDTWGLIRQQVLPSREEFSRHRWLIVRTGKYHERSGLIFLQEEVTRQWQNIVYTKSSADRRLSIAERVPRKSNPRLKVTQGGVRVIRANAVADSARGRYSSRLEWGRKLRPALEVRILGRSGIRFGNIHQVGNPALSVVEDGGHFVAHAEVDRQVGTESPVILDISSEKGLSHFTRCNCGGYARLKMHRLVVEETSYAVEVPPSTRVLPGNVVVLHPLDVRTEFQGMGPMRPERIVSELIIVKGVDVIGG